MESTRLPGARPVELAARERDTLRLLADTLVPRSGMPDDPLGTSATDLGVDVLAVEAISTQPPEVQRQFLQLLRAVDNRFLNLVLTGRPSRFRTMRPEAREKYLLSWASSRLEVKRRAFHSIKRLVCFLTYSALPDGKENPTWAAIGYDPRPDGPHKTPPKLTLRPLAVEGESTFDADVAVIGSGAGGAVIAAKVAEAGYRVLVIEAAPLRAPDAFPRRELPGTDTTLERHGLLTTKDNAFGILQGHAAGGGTAINWMTCLPPPHATLEEWEQLYGIPGLTGPGFRAHVDEVWERLGVNTDSAVQTPTSNVLRRGCEALGYEEGVDFHVTPKNARGCANRCDLCNFGCVYGAKQSTLVTYLPDAQKHGAQFLFDTEARAIVLRGDVAVGVEAVHRQNGRETPVHVRARVVVVAAGALQTPALLLRSGLRHRGVGRGLRFDPTSAVGGVYDEPIRMWAGVPQTLHIDKWLRVDGDHGFWLETVPAHPGLTALGTPWRGGQAHKDSMRRYAHVAANIVLIRDWGSGRVTTDHEGNPAVHYRMTLDDRNMMARGIVESARIHAAAGARAVWSLHNAGCEIPERNGRISDSEVDAFAARVHALGVKPNALALFSAHAMGSVPMGASDRMPTRTDGRLRGVENVYIGDGSVLPSAPGVNPMITIMAMARRTAARVADALTPTA